MVICLTPNPRLLYDGLMYFVALTCMFFYSMGRQSSINRSSYRHKHGEPPPTSSGRSYNSVIWVYLLFLKRHRERLPCVSCSVDLAYATTWIMSQRILLHVRGA